MDLHEALAQATMSRDEAEARIYGWLPGIVTDVDTKLMQIKARIGKQGDNESTDWLVPIGMGSMESLPEVGDPVGVMFHDGDVHRGAYFYLPQSTTKGRPTQPIPLGTNLVGMFNYLVTQFNQLRTDFNTFISSTYNAHTHVVSGTANLTTGAVAGTAAPTTATGSSTTAAQANKGKASDGSVVSDNSSSAVVLSKRSLVR